VPTEDVLRGLLAAAPDALLACTPEGRIVFMNDQVERIFGWSRAELVGRTVDRLVPHPTLGEHPLLRVGDRAAGQPSEAELGIELLATRRDGSVFPAEISVSSFDAGDGILVAAAIRDVTSTRRTEHRFRALLESAPDPILGVDVDGRIELVNAQAERLFGWPAAELVGQQIEVLVPDAARARHLVHRSAYVSDPVPRPMGGGLQLSAQRRDGTTFPAEVSLSAVTDQPGSLIVLAAVRDVTDRIELEAERGRRLLAERQERTQRLESLGQLAGGVAHDFNNLLGVILNYTTLLTRRATDEEVRADLDEIRAAAERAGGLTRQLLTFARRDHVELEPIDVSEIAASVVSMLERTFGENIELQLDLDALPVVTIGDEHQIEQIILNLAFNARDAMPSGGRITIATERGGTDVILRVADTGCGMPPEVLARAFEPFFTTKPTGHGTGLGLATVFGVAHQHGGTVSIDSVLDSGTTVTVRLPAAAGTDGVALRHISAPDGAPDGALGGRERVLVVEDEPALRAATARILGEMGYLVQVATDGVDALALFDLDPAAFDIVVTDVAMPRMRGDELARRLSERSPALPVVFVSGYDSGDVPMNGRLLAKPVAEATLLRTIREVLDAG